MRCSARRAAARRRCSTSSPASSARREGASCSTTATSRDLPTEERNIAQVFQFPVIYDTMTVRENLAFPLKNRGVPAAAIGSGSREIARLLDLDADARPQGARPHRRREAEDLARPRPGPRRMSPPILFDEPLTVIDPHLKWQLRSKLKALHRALDLTMIYVTHDQTEALTFADKVVVMHDGAVVQIGTPEELFERPAHTFVGYFIGSPGHERAARRVEGATALCRRRAIALPRSLRRPAAGQRSSSASGPNSSHCAATGTGLPVHGARASTISAAPHRPRRAARQPLAATRAGGRSPSTATEAALVFDRAADPRLRRRPPRRGRRADGQAAQQPRLVPRPAGLRRSSPSRRSCR